MALLTAPAQQTKGTRGPPTHSHGALSSGKVSLRSLARRVTEIQIQGRVTQEIQNPPLPPSS